ncbi:hypothetical protein [Streptomyces sp. SDr-06]|uniref:hypothetical protein n=1 Tax=Streptomyces sp. SDr-06 TaxID=2267702 RepID=UPI001CB961B0|nr:hypothetical protein [Streptomyces sp. SDr-06]
MSQFRVVPRVVICGVPPVAVQWPQVSVMVATPSSAAATVVDSSRRVTLSVQRCRLRASSWTFEVHAKLALP